MNHYYLIPIILFLFFNCLENLQNKQKPYYGILKPTLFDTNECKSPPEGMICIPISSSKNDEQKYIPTFYIDKYEVTNADYEKCVNDKFCKPNLFMKSKQNKSFVGSLQPAISLTYEMAHQFCTWSGKRIPTEGEWNKTYRYIFNNDKTYKDKELKSQS